MHSNTDYVHRRDKIIYIEIRVGRAGFVFCVRRLVRSNFTLEIEYQNIVTPHYSVCLAPCVCKDTNKECFLFIKQGAKDLELSCFYDHVL